MKLLSTIILLCFTVATVARENEQESESEARILPVYHGLDPIPRRATGLCGLPPKGGQDGMPVTFSVQLTWEGGVTGPQGADLAEAQRTAMSVLLENGDSNHPLSLGDDDPDNHVIACLTETSPAVSVSVIAGFFHDPGDDANPETNIDVISKMIE